MNFVQIEFPLFMMVVFATYWLLRDRRWQNALLVLASALFYGWVHPWFLLLLYFSAVLDFTIGRTMGRYPQYRPYLVVLSLIGNLGVLGFFKYFNFFIANVKGAFLLAGVETDLRSLDILLPVGVSFYTFQTMSYTIDIYRGELKARSNFLDYLVYVSFFPQLVAGPIERAGRLLPQVEKRRVFSFDKLVSGFSLAWWGAFKKIVIADTLASFADKIFILDDPSGPEIWAGCIVFTVQIFADFSGYTDMARGTARMLGFELVENFRSPFLATSTPDFWQRWHISLSQWIRDYIMVPLLGTGRVTTARYIYAALITFTLIGFWHGASWNFVLFGLYHGLWICVYRFVDLYMPKRLTELPGAYWFAVAFHLVAVAVPGSLLFRETRVERIFSHIQLNPFVAEPDQWIAATTVVGVTAIFALPLILSHFVEHHWWDRLRKSVFWWPLQTTAWSALGLVMALFYRDTSYDFIYFQF
ncbi:MAG: alginate O-acetyltransferase complex protein AlgI [Myxococcota bacterium]|jgi:alginate O-acetyltransferase complex protein AlgI